MKFSAAAKAALAFAVLVFVYFFGGYSDRHELFPFSAVHDLRARFKEKPSSRYGINDVGRLSSDDLKQAAVCPQQTDRTAVLLILGQSNAGNHGGQRFGSEHGDQVINFYGGRCFVASSPLLGSDGTNGEYWTELGNLLIASGAFDRVILAPAAISGSEVSRWAPGGDLNPSMIDTATGLKQANYRATHVLWVQGEIDYVNGTSESDYRNRFLSLVYSLRSSGVSAPVYIAVATKCLEASNRGTRFHSADNPVARAQKALVDPAAGLRSGVDSDVLLDTLDRFDDCHFGGSGEQKVAKAWAELIDKRGLPDR